MQLFRPKKPSTLNPVKPPAVRFKETKSVGQIGPRFLGAGVSHRQLARQLDDSRHDLVNPWPHDQL